MYTLRYIVSKEVYYMKYTRISILLSIVLITVLVATSCMPTEPTPAPAPTPKLEAPEEQSPQITSLNKNTDGMKEDPAPDFTLKGFDDQDHKLSDNYQDVVVLNFWAVGCPPCVEEMPDLNKINDLDYATVVTVAPDGVLGNEFERSKQFIQQYGTVALWDPDRTTLDLYPSQYFPHTYVIDRTGTIRYAIRGGTNYDELKEKVDKVNDLG